MLKRLDGKIALITGANSGTGQSEKIAERAVYLASKWPDDVTGQSFTIDGGLELDWGHGA